MRLSAQSEGTAAAHHNQPQRSSSRRRRRHEGRRGDGGGERSAGGRGAGGGAGERDGGGRDGGRGGQQAQCRRARWAAGVVPGSAMAAGARWRARWRRARSRRADERDAGERCRRTRCRRARCRGARCRQARCRRARRRAVPKSAVPGSTMPSRFQSTADVPMTSAKRENGCDAVDGLTGHGASGARMCKGIHRPRDRRCRCEPVGPWTSGLTHADRSIQPVGSPQGGVCRCGSRAVGRSWVLRGVHMQRRTWRCRI